MTEYDDFSFPRMPTFENVGDEEWIVTEREAAQMLGGILRAMVIAIRSVTPEEDQKNIAACMAMYLFDEFEITPEWLEADTPD